MLLVVIIYMGTNVHGVLHFFNMFLWFCVMYHVISQQTWVFSLTHIYYQYLDLSYPL
jgi:hypothetical protein